MKPAVLPTIAALRAALEPLRRNGVSIGLVPTMGALHAGHGALVDSARRATGCVVVSIFVNPTQFDRRDDFQNYGRDLDSDLAFCAARGVDLVFAPAESEMYPRASATTVEVTELSERLCGEFRPGHFRGVATVVTKLFHIVQPDAAYFGEKDAQQLAVIRRMVADLDFPLEVVGVPTVRETDGLALSSRNARLTPEERSAAPLLYRALAAARDKIESGCREAAAVRQTGLDILPSPLFRVDYFEVADAARMQPVERIEGPVCVAAAVWLGATRLIDNVLWAPPAAR